MRSSASNVRADKDSEKRQRQAIEAFAKAAGYSIVETFYDSAVSGADPVGERPGFAKMLERLLANGAKTIIVESPDRFARDLMVQLTGHDMLKVRGVTLIAASSPMHFIEDTPTARLVRQVLGAIAEFKKRRWSPNWRPRVGANGRPASRSTVARATPRRAQRSSSGRRISPSPRGSGD
jgi:DNA invertase Pin-like site-specific DNA recombinase